MAQSHPAIFQHAQVNGGQPLIVQTGMDDVRWSYELNVAVFPTYAGEVIQILSVYINDISVRGTVDAYHTGRYDHPGAEEIYKYFSEYLQIASQGRTLNATPGKTAYNQTPMSFTYYERNWSFFIQPKELPGWRQGRDVVAPEWQLTAHVFDDERSDLGVIKDGIKSVLSEGGAADSALGDTDFTLKGEIGFINENPFSDPFTDAGNNFDPTKTKEAWTKVGDEFNKLIPAYLTEQNFETITGVIGSKPAFGRMDVQVDQKALAKKGGK